MAGSVDEADELVDETFRRARPQLGPCDGPPVLRARLHRLATTVCLDALAGRTPRVLPPDLEPATTGVGFGFGTAEMVPRTDIPWLQPIPDHLWEPAAAPDDAVERDTIGLAFIAALQHLPPRNRAILVMSDVLGCPTDHVAEYLVLPEATVAEMLHRARQLVHDRLPAPRDARDARDGRDGRDDEVLRRYMAAVDRSDLAAFGELLADDVRASLPPWTIWLDGRPALLASLGETWDPRSPEYFGSFRTQGTRANGQPAVATYRRAPGDDPGPYRAFAVTVLRVEHGRITDIVGFHDPSLFPTFHLPATLPPL
jgi:RNA polymerase sigma-70 factor (ECF subfamily)